MTCLEVTSHFRNQDAFEALAAVIQQSALLTTFTLRRLLCGFHSAAVLIAAVAQSRNLTDLQLQECGIDNTDLDSLVTAIE